MTVREKLIELIEQSRITSSKDAVCINGSGYIADLLIKNGVTFATDTNVGSKWISVEDRLPEEEQLVLLLCKNEARFVGYCTFNSYEPEPRWRIKTALNSTKLLNKGRVTHWMPLPEPPKEESK